MINQFLSALLATSILTTTLVSPLPIEQDLASHSMSLNDRYPVKSVSDIFKDNILLNMSYMDGLVKSKSDLNWDLVQKPFEYQFTLKPGETFAFHDDLLPEYQGKIVKTTGAHFNSNEGFKSDGYLVGDGVCHLASLVNWVAKDAGLLVVAPTNHDFATIPEISKDNGVAIYVNPYAKGLSNEKQNLYITNNKSYPVVFKFKYDGDKLALTISELK